MQQLNPVTQAPVFAVSVAIAAHAVAVMHVPGAPPHSHAAATCASGAASGAGLSMLAWIADFAAREQAAASIASMIIERTVAASVSSAMLSTGDQRATNAGSPNTERKKLHTSARSAND